MIFQGHQPDSFTGVTKNSLIQFYIFTKSETIQLIMMITARILKTICWVFFLRWSGETEPCFEFFNRDEPDIP